ncbi:hypothetical protein AB0J25_11925 [Streptomyces sp. NPDC049910]|uniref:hypothetical protein n=1 Tax=Streptomyces sp. NPDC049910 TaxID=3155278 RepID=UPI003429610E
MRTRTIPAAVLTAALALTGCGSSEETNEPAADVPAYKVVKQDTSGNKRNITVEINHDNDLRAIFDDVTDKLTDEAGYYVMINCSSGGTPSVDNRLANGQKAIGNMGAATTGLEPGGTEFAAVDDRQCPAT